MKNKFGMLNRTVKRAFKNFKHNQQGQVLPLVLILLVLGSTILAGALAYASASLKTAEITEDRAEELNAADSGVRYALWKLTNDFSSLVFPYSHSFNENGKSVLVTVEVIENTTYNKVMKITSIGSGPGSNTTIETYVTKMIDLWKNAASSGVGIDPPSCTAIENGTIIIDGPTVPRVCADPPEAPYDTTEWPFLGGTLRTRYISQVALPAYTLNDWNVDEPGKNIITPLLAQPVQQGAVYPLNINNRGGDPTLVATIGAVSPGPWSTVFVEQAAAKGKLNIGMNSVSDFTLNLNRNTIYVEGAIDIGGKCKITGSGCIIATGDIYFTPTMTTTENDFVFVLSLYGKVTFQPNGSYYGSVAGADVIGMQPGNLLKLTKPPRAGVNFPTEGAGLNAVWVADTWEINRNTGSLPLSVATASLSPGEETRPYLYTLNASGGSGTYNWSITGILPGGVTLTPATGVISGTPASGSAGNYPITVEVSDGAGTATKDLTLTIYTQPVITPASLPSGTVGVLYPPQTLNVTGGLAPFTWTKSSGILPPGISVSSTGVISGTPSAGGGSPYIFVIEVTDSLIGKDQETFSITINVDPLVITTISPLPNGKKNKNYGTEVPFNPVYLMATGGVPPYTWSITAGILPNNLTLDGVTGLISGIAKPTGVGTWSITFRVTDSAVPGNTTTKVFSITITN